MIVLQRPNISHKEAYEKMFKTWKEYEDISDASPGTLFAWNDYCQFLQYVESLQNNPPPNRAFATLFFAIKDNEIIGAIDIRHEIESSEYLKNFGGHIGYGIFPTERGKWYATEMLKLWLLEAKKLVTDREKVLLVCLDTNIASAKVIEKNGWQLEWKIKDDEWNIRRRYWIDL